MELLIVTGMSGSGKSKAISALEDIGYYCIDNLPPNFLLNFTDFMRNGEEFARKVAITIDSRSKDMFLSMANVLDQLDERKINYSLMFLDAEDGVLLHRYKETRRIHPLMNDEVKHLQEAINLERTILNPIRDRADYYINTSLYDSQKLKDRIVEIFTNGEEGEMIINFISFGFKKGILTDADLVFDVRCLPNPFYVDELKPLTGKDQKVRDYVMGFEESTELYKRIRDLLEYSIPLYKKEGKMQLVVGLGCTGGQHRSATFAILLHDYFVSKGYKCTVSHRDINKK